MVIIDRTDNPAIPLYHTTSYQALVADLLDCHKNRVKFLTEQAGKQVTKSYYMDSTQDKFWRENSCIPFPDAVTNNDNQLRELTQKEQKIRATASNSTASRILIIYYSNGFIKRFS